MPAAIDHRVVYNNCIQYLELYINDLAAIQDEVFNVFKEQFKLEQICEPTSSPKYLTVMSKFVAVCAERGDIYKNVMKCYTLWKDKLEPHVKDCSKKHMYAVLPLRLAACFFLNGDYYKALLCLRHSIRLEHKSLALRIMALRWSVYLGEWEMLEMALEFEKLKPPKSAGDNDSVTAQLLFATEIAKNFLDFNRDHKSRPICAKRILELTNEINADTRTTFHTFESQLFANWICSQLPKVGNFRVDDLEFLDSFNCLHRAVSKAEGVMKNRVNGIQKENVQLEFKKAATDPTDFMKVCSSVAECCDIRRDYSIELLNVGLIGDSAANCQLGLWGALRTGVLFRTQQFVNMNTLIRLCVVHPDFKNDLPNCLEMMRSMYSSEYAQSKNSLFGCSKKKPAEVTFSDEAPADIESSLARNATAKSPSRAMQKSVAASIMESFEELRLESTKTPPRGRSPGRVASKFIDSFHELTLSETKSYLHELSENCCCSVCEFCKVNYNAAFEYWFSSFLYESMSDAAIQAVEENFHAIRAQVAVEQRAVLGKKVKPRPPTTMCETLAMCAVRWLRRLEDSSWDRENAKLKALRDGVVKSALKASGVGVRVHR
ncbi:unnamed protein product [Heligmosomoides polygyrus]|uniref:Separase n=1 Tax=Heligmosomoides polygyrus TaxID=6339 RepID=A0A183FRD8_HELPZ|nr:unnamed protein product [Heligmosomoides polygyrus]